LTATAMKSMRGAVQPPHPSRVGCEQNDQAQQEWKMI